MLAAVLAVALAPSLAVAPTPTLAATPTTSLGLLPAPVLGATTPAEPVVGQLETVTPVAGVVRVRIKGTPHFVRLRGPLSVPDESEVDATAGRVQVTVATPQTGQTSSTLAYKGRFLLHQDAPPGAETHLDLSQPLTGCGGSRRGRRATARGGRARVAAHGHRSSTSRRLWVSDNGGNWGTGGHDVSTTGEGTRWLTLDECRRSEVRVSEGTVLVHDLIRHTFATVTAGHRYVAAQPTVEGRALMPPLGQVFTGVSGGSAHAFQSQVGKHPAVLGYFANWGESIETPLSEAHGAHARLLLHISTDIGYGGQAAEIISPGEIAHGDGDGYLLALSRQLTQSGRAAYIALLPEMNQANNAYCAFTASGASRDRAHSTAAYRQAWRRSVLILRGGAAALIDHRLRALGLPPVRTGQVTLPSPRVAFMWAPQTAGTPTIPANEPAAYYPGSAYVDIVGTDFYSAYPNFAGLARLYGAYRPKPFGFNEWAMWQSANPGFVSQLFAFVRAHRRIGLMLYNQGLNPVGPFRLYRFPAATAEIRRQLRAPRFLAYTPEWAGARGSIASAFTTRSLTSPLAPRLSARSSASRAPSRSIMRSRRRPRRSHAPASEGPRSAARRAASSARSTAPTSS